MIIWILQSLFFLAQMVALMFLGVYWMLHDTLVQPDKTIRHGLVFLACVVFINIMKGVYSMGQRTEKLNDEYQKRAIARGETQCKPNSTHSM